MIGTVIKRRIKNHKGKLNLNCTALKVQIASVNTIVKIINDNRLLVCVLNKYYNNNNKHMNWTYYFVVNAHIVSSKLNVRQSLICWLTDWMTVGVVALVFFFAFSRSLFFFYFFLLFFNWMALCLFVNSCFVLLKTFIEPTATINQNGKTFVFIHK